MARTACLLTISRSLEHNQTFNKGFGHTLLVSGTCLDFDTNPGPFCVDHHADE